MFDELDDPVAPHPGEAARAAVAARSARLRLRRRAAWGGGAASALLVVAALTYALPGDRRSLDVVVTETATPTATAVETPEPTPATPSPTATPTPTPRPAPSSEPAEEPPPPPPPPPTTTAPRRPTATPTESLPFDQAPDGKPGWSTGFTWCHDATALPPEGAGPYPGVTLALELPSTTFVAGRSYTGHLVVTNDADHSVSFDAWSSGSTVAVDDAGHGSAGKGNDAMISHHVELDPGEEWSLDVGVSTVGCGDTPRDGDRPLPPGAYRMTAGLHWSNRSAWSGPSPEPEPSPTHDPASGEWYVAPHDVRLTESR